MGVKVASLILLVIHAVLALPLLVLGVGSFLFGALFNDSGEPLIIVFLFFMGLPLLVAGSFIYGIKLYRKSLYLKASLLSIASSIVAIVVMSSFYFTFFALPEEQEETRQFSCPSGKTFRAFFSSMNSTDTYDSILVSSDNFSIGYFDIKTQAFNPYPSATASPLVQLLTKSEDLEQCRNAEGDSLWTAFSENKLDGQSRR